MSLMAKNSDTHILVVDDEPDIAESLVDYLVTKEGYQVSRVGSGEEAIAFLHGTTERKRPAVDLVLLDVRMPGFRGWRCWPGFGIMTNCNIFGLLC